MKKQIPLLWEYKSRGDIKFKSQIKENEPPVSIMRKESLNIPSIQEMDIVRHFTALSKINFGIVDGIYPLGSCTMKYNPILNETVAAMEGFIKSHPQDEHSSQGSMEVIYQCQKWLSLISGFKNVSIQSSAGAQGEFIGLNIINSYFKNRGEFKRTKVIIPDSAHGTNPATAAMLKCNTITLKTNEEGMMHLNELERILKEHKTEIMAIMITLPNTLGVFEKHIEKAIKMIHDEGAMVYFDGANMNALCGILKPASLNVDIMHFNLHKTFSTPHGGGGPGSGPVACSDELKDFLTPYVEIENGRFVFIKPPKSIGSIKSFHGNFAVVLRALAYLKTNGVDELKNNSEIAILNANYLIKKLQDKIKIPYPKNCMHEFVAQNNLESVKALDIAKAMLDNFIYAPTIYFPLIVKEALMIEPTETENKESLDAFINIFSNILDTASKDPEKIKKAPQNTPVGRLDETLANKNPKLKYKL